MNKIIALISVLLLGLTASANAGTTSTSTTVTAQDSASCTINSISAPTTASMTANGSVAQVSGSIYVQCTSGSTYNLEFGPGLYGSDGATPTRYVANGSNKLQYQIFQVSNYTVPWGDTIGTNTYARSADGTSQGFGIFVQFNAAPATLPAGSYTDTVAITVSY